MTTVHPAAIAGATLIAIEPALEFHGVNMPTTPAGSITTLDVPTVLTRSKSSRTFLKCRKMFAARLLEPFARSCGAPLSTAIPMAISACYLNNGQACIAASLLIVPEDRLDEVKRLAKAAVEKIKMGDPRDKDVTLGPLASTKQYKRVQQYIKSGIEEGAQLVIGGEGHPQGLEGGNFIKPTVFANVTPEMRIAKEEIFGPVLSILTYKTEAEAIEIANDTEFGLIAYVSSAHPERATRVARKLAAGRVLINPLSHDPFAPFGGFKQSGIGREGGIFGLQEYLEPKAIIG